MICTKSELIETIKSMTGLQEQEIKIECRVGIVTVTRCKELKEEIKETVRTETPLDTVIEWVVDKK